MSRQVALIPSQGASTWAFRNAVKAVVAQVCTAIVVDAVVGSRVYVLEWTDSTGVLKGRFIVGAMVQGATYTVTGFQAAAASTMNLGTDRSITFPLPPNMLAEVGDVFVVRDTSVISAGDRIGNVSITLDL